METLVGGDDVWVAEERDEELGADIPEAHPLGQGTGGRVGPVWNGGMFGCACGEFGVGSESLNENGIG